MSGSARGHRPGCPSSPPESSRSAAVRRRVAALLILPLLALSLLSLTPQAAAAEVQTNCPGPRTGDTRFDPDKWPYTKTPTYEKDNIYGVGCLDVMVSEAYKASAAEASEGSAKHYAFRVTSKIAPGPRGIPHTQYFEYDIKLGGTAKKGEDYEFFKKGPSSHLPGRIGFLFDSSKTWVLRDAPPGFVTAAFIFRILDDDEVEPDETVTFTIGYRKPSKGGQAEYQIGTASATFTIQNDDVAPTPQRPRISIAPKTSSITEGASATFTLTATPAPAAPVQVGVTVATNGDYGITAAKRTVTIPTTGSYELTLATTDDDADEPDGSVTATLNAGDGYTIGKKTSSGKVAIADDDLPPPEVTIAAGAGVTEGGSATFTLTADPAPAADLAVSVTVAATGDYGITAGTQTVTIPTTGSATLKLATAGDDVDEADGSVTVTVTDGDGYTVGDATAGTVAIADDDVPEVEIAAGSGVTEGGDASFTLTATPAPAADLPVSVTVAAAGDWGVTAGPRTVTIPITGSVTLTLTTAGDDADEADGSVSVTVTAGEGYTVGSSASGTVSIQDDDAPPEPAVTIAAGASPVTEGGDATFTLTATPAPAADLAVSVTVAADGDYGVTAGPRTVTIPTTGSATLTLTTAGDDVDEADGSVSVTVTAGEGYTVGSSASGTVSIADDDASPEPAVTIAAGTSPVTEGGAASFTLTATPAPTADLAVSVTVATAGDYGVNAGPRTVTIPTTGSVTLTLATAGDGTDEADGSVTVTVTDGDGYTVGSSASGSVTVRDDDEAGAPDWTDFQTVVNRIIVARDNPTNAWAKGGGNAVHVAKWNRVLEAIGYDTGTGLSPMPASEIHANAAKWPESTFKAASVYLKSLDGKDPDEPEIAVSGGNAVTEGGDATFTITATPAPTSPLAVSVTVATDGDYGVPAGPRTVTVPTTGSYTLTLATTGDGTDEADGSVTVTATDGDGYTVGASASATVAVRDDDAPQPVVTISAGSAVTEGGSARFTLTANPAPTAPLPVSVTIATVGDYGISAGSRTVSIPTTGSATLTLATSDDGTDEPDGSVTATVQPGAGYTVGTSATGTVAVRDDDLPPPVVTIAAKASSVTEGGDAAFALTADRAPDADLTVTLSVSETGDGDHVAAADEGPVEAVIAKGATEAVIRVATVNDDVDEPDGSAVVTVQAGADYTVGDPASASVEVKDDDITMLPTLSVADATAEEGVTWLMPFTVRLSAAAAETVAVRVDTRDTTPVSATARRDYWPVKGRTVTFRPGETERTVEVLVYDDYHDEDAETFELVLSEAKGAAIGDGVAVGTIVNDDPMPAAFLSRFGRTVAEQALGGIAGRMSAPRPPGVQGALAGQAVSFDPAPANSEAELAMAGIARSFGNAAGGRGHDIAGMGTPPSGTMSAREALLGSSFSMTGQRDGSGGSMAFWGRAAQGSFDGREETFTLAGTATTAMLGADYARGRLLIGFALVQSNGEGDYRDTKTTPRLPSQACPADAEGTDAELCRNAVRAGDGEVEASLTAAIPYVAMRVSERLKFWGAGGHGMGEVTLKTELGGRYGTETNWSMAAGGLRGDLLAPPVEGGGVALAMTSDALWTRTSSEKTRDLAASESDATRLRISLEGSYHIALGGGTVTPKLELGARHDGGDAETGFGGELGGGVKWTDPGMGLSLDVSGRMLLAHVDADLKDWGFSAALAYDPAPATKRGASLSLRQEFGGQATGGLDALLQPATLGDRTGSGEATSRWALEAAYGFPAFGGRWTGSPHAGFGLATGARDYSVGWRFAPEAADASDFTFDLKATRRENDATEAEHTVGFEVNVRW